MSRNVHRILVAAALLSIACAACSKPGPPEKEQPPVPQAHAQLRDAIQGPIDRAKVPTRWRNKDLAALYFSALDIGLTRRDLLRFLKAYFQRPLRDTLRDEAALLGWLERKAARLHARYQRLLAHGLAANLP